MSWTSTPVPNLVALSLAGASPHICEIYNPNVPFLLVRCPVLTLLFSGARPGRTPGWIFTVDGSNDAIPHKEVPFGGQDNES